MISSIKALIYTSKKSQAFFVWFDVCEFRELAVEKIYKD